MAAFRCWRLASASDADMDPQLLDHYARELRHVRETAGEFARDFPQVAARLGLAGLERGSECPDPYVERLLEGFAFLTARVHLKVDAEFPRFSQHLLDTVYPHYLPPTPSMTVVQMQPSLQEGALAAGYVVPRHSVLRGRLGPRQQTPCRYRTGHDVTLLPIEVAQAEYRPFVGDLAGSRMPGIAEARATLRVRLRATAGLTFDRIRLQSLPFFLAGDSRTATRLHELLLARTVGVMLRPPVPTGAAANGARRDASSSWEHGLTTDSLAPFGFDDKQALLPFGPRSFQGYRLLHEYFAFPQRFLFVELSDLGPVAARHAGSELEIIFLLDRGDPTLEGAVHASHFALYCTPAINLFSKRVDRIHLDDTNHEYQVIPDRVRPMDYEVHSVSEVVGLGADDLRQEFQPLYGAHRRADGAGAFFTVRREARRLSSRQQQQGTRTPYTGSESFVALVDGSHGPFRSQLKQLSIEALCTNRDLPMLMPVGQDVGGTDFTLEVGAPVESVRCIEGPTPPRPSHAHKDVTWRLISHLSLNYLSLTDAANGGGATALRELLRLYSDFGDATMRGQVESLRNVSSQAEVQRFPGPGPVSFGRGLKITLTCDEASAEGWGAFLLGSVLERFFAKYVSINSFTKTVLRTIQRGEIIAWPARLGRRHIL
jgi:type VI secretion system protein ImpG